MKPMAKLHLNRQRLYEKICEDTIGQAGNTGGDTSEEPHKRHRNSKYRLLGSIIIILLIV